MVDLPVLLLLGFAVALLLWHLWREIVIAVILIGTALIFAGLFTITEQISRAS